MKTKDMTLVALFAALTAVGAYIRIPLPYIPFTLQFFFCAMSGMLLGSRLGMLSQLTYVLVGLAGFPIFTEGGGPSYILKPSFGYLLGFILCSFVIGHLTEKLRKVTVLRLFLTVLAGMAALYLIGVPYLYMIYNLYLGKAKTVWWAVYWGFLTFAAGDLIISYAAAVLGKKLLPAIKRHT
jgi:biotin transport system substrate-specific component